MKVQVTIKYVWGLFLKGYKKRSFNKHIKQVDYILAIHFCNQFYIFYYYKSEIILLKNDTDCVWKK